MIKVLISGICGFAGSCVATALLDERSKVELTGFDNLSRAGSPLNIEQLRARGVKLFHADVRSTSDLELIPSFDWVIDAAANPSVLAGVDGATTTRQLLETNLYGSVNLLELAKKFRAGFILLSTSRVYSVRELSRLPLIKKGNSFELDPSAKVPRGVSANGINEEFSTQPPLSLYGTSKLASEMIALEYAEAFGLPVWINRCGILAGAGQFGRPDQGILSYWINSYLRRQPLRYVGFGGHGYQTRDCLHPRDLASVLWKQMTTTAGEKTRVANFGGGNENCVSLAQLSDWCAHRFGQHKVFRQQESRLFDVPWLVMDSSVALRTWSWRPQTRLENILDEVAKHAEIHPEWLRLSCGFNS